MFSWRSHKENTELTERFSILENGRLIQDLSGIHRLGKLTVNEGFLAVYVFTVQLSSVLEDDQERHTIHLIALFHLKIN